jgi:hypothetical protein
VAALDYAGLHVSPLVVGQALGLTSFFSFFLSFFLSFCSFDFFNFEILYFFKNNF